MSDSILRAQPELGAQAASLTDAKHLQTRAEPKSELKSEPPMTRAKPSAFAPYAQSPLHPFDLGAKARAQDASCAVWMNEVPLLGYIMLRGDVLDLAFTSAILAVLGIALPTEPSTLLAFEDGVAVWQSPDEWLLVCRAVKRSACQSALETALHAVHAQVVDNSGGLTLVYVSGARHVELLRHVSVYDIESIKTGRAVSTMCSKVGMTVFRVDANGLCVIVRRSFADYAWRLLETAARPYGLGISALSVRAEHPVLRLL